MNPQTLPTGRLMEEYRDTLLRLGADRTSTVLARQADRLGEEILRRMSW